MVVRRGSKVSVLVVPVSSDRGWSDRLHCMSGSTERRSTTDTEQVRLRGEPARTGRGLLDDTITTGTGRAVGRGGDEGSLHVVNNPHSLDTTVSTCTQIRNWL